jgi:hypothetical protein
MNPLLIAALAGLGYLYLRSRRGSDAQSPSVPEAPTAPSPKPAAAPMPGGGPKSSRPDPKPAAVSLVGLRGIPDSVDPSWFVRPSSITDRAFRFFMPEDNHPQIIMGFGWEALPFENPGADEKKQLLIAVQSAARTAKEKFQIATSWFEEEFIKVLTHPAVAPTLPTLASPYSRLIPATTLYPFGFEKSRDLLAEKGLEFAMPRAICLLREGPISQGLAQKGENPFRVVYARRGDFALHVAALFALKHRSTRYAFRNSLQMDILEVFVRSRSTAYALSTMI